VSRFVTTSKLSIRHPAGVVNSTTSPVRTTRTRDPGETTTYDRSTDALTTAITPSLPSRPASVTDAFSGSTPAATGSSNKATESGDPAASRASATGVNDASSPAAGCPDVSGATIPWATHASSGATTSPGSPTARASIDSTPDAGVTAKRIDGTGNAVVAVDDGPADPSGFPPRSHATSRTSAARTPAPATILRIPIEDTDDPRHGRGPRTSSYVMEDQSTRPILVVGDRGADRWDVAWALHEAGIGAEQAPSAADARRRVADGRVAGVVVDSAIDEATLLSISLELRPDPETGDMPFILVAHRSAPSSVVERVRRLLQASWSSEPK
jgi:hypothetical protein